MLCLLLADMNSTAGLGPVAAIGVGVTLLVMVTLLPALLVIFGRWIFWPKRPTFGSPSPPRRACGPRSAARSRSRPRRSGSVTTVAAGRGLPRAVQARRQRPLHRGALHQGVRLDRRPEGPDRARPGRRLHTAHGGRPTPSRPTRSRDGDGGDRGRSAAPTSPSSRTASRFHRHRSTADAASPRGVRHGRARSATPCTTSRARTPSSAAAPRSSSTSRPPPTATTS